MRDRKKEPNNTPRHLINPAMEKAINEAFAKAKNGIYKKPELSIDELKIIKAIDES